MNTFEVAQISLITAIDLAYVIFEFREIVQRRTFRTLGIKIKYIFQEVAILVFLIVMTILAIGGRGDEFKNSGFAHVLGVIVIVAVLVAICSEAIAVVWNAVISIMDFIAQRKENKRNEQIKKITAIEERSRIKSDDQEICYTKKTSKIHSITNLPPNTLQNPKGTYSVIGSESTGKLEANGSSKIQSTILKPKENASRDLGQ